MEQVTLRVQVTTNDPPIINAFKRIAAGDKGARHPGKRGISTLILEALIFYVRSSQGQERIAILAGEGTPTPFLFSPAPAVVPASTPVYDDIRSSNQDEPLTDSPIEEECDCPLAPQGPDDLL